MESRDFLIQIHALPECQFELAKLSKHLCPSMLVTELGKLDLTKLPSLADIYVTHLKPGEGEAIMREISESYSALPVLALKSQQVLKLLNPTLA